MRDQEVSAGKLTLAGTMNSRAEQGEKTREGNLIVERFNHRKAAGRSLPEIWSGKKGLDLVLGDSDNVRLSGTG